MSDRYKFRLWDTDSKEYYKVGRVGSGWQWFNVQSNGDVITGVDDDIDEPEENRWVLEQNSTYKYKDGKKEAYEGDICRYDNRLFEVKWMTTGHGLYLSPLDGSVAFSVSFIEDAVFVRTIHDKESK